jgi:PhnB protein
MLPIKAHRQRQGDRMNAAQTSPSNTFIQPYLFFGGRCEQALEFYRSALNAELIMLMRFNESPKPLPPGVLQTGFESKVMHCSFRIGTTTVMASDGCSDKSSFSGFSLSLTLASVDEAHRVFTLLADGGQVQMPLGKTFWSPCYGMLTDRFGIGWMVSAAEASA